MEERRLRLARSTTQPSNSEVVEAAVEALPG
jgi:hypothetical protein